MLLDLPVLGEHWAYIAPGRPVVPAVSRKEWCRSELDHFVLAGLEARGLAPSPEAERAVWLRRLSLDLIGLPPTLAELEASETHEQAVDRLLASPRFGERWASMWLDLARYADTQGYEKDTLRTIWAYRDWVIKAFNDDMPFDEFTIEQLAGDLLPLPTPQQLAATAFHRNTLTNTEGGSDQEEFRLKAVFDRVNTTWTTWMGVTMECARCHDHPSEPFTQRDYYQSLAFFNNTVDAGEGDDRPLLELQPIGEGDPARTTSVPIMRELPTEQARLTRLFHRGNWLDPREAVLPGVPSIFPPLPAGPTDRLALARWLVSAENPLPARVMVNRLWAQLFGTGLVETEENLGQTGAAPSSQPLLDWLAWHFAHDWHWSMTRVLREIVLSSTFRQRSGYAAADPENRGLARGPRFRLPAEMLRDQALAAAGLLSAKMYGRSVMPPQPDGVWQVVYNVQRWVPSRGEDRYRRGLYTFWRRTSPYPGLTLFDAPSRESCTPRRERTSSPAAALALLNDPVYVEAAGALGRRMAQAGGDTPRERIRYGWRLLLAREPSEQTLVPLERLLAGADYTAVATALLNLDETVTLE
jgi:hypothetical protein